MKTQEQEILEGNPGRRPINEKAPVIKGRVPSPPKFLNKIAKYKYGQLARLTGPDGSRVAGQADGETMAMAAFAYSKFRTAQKAIEGSKEYYITASGAIKKHPAASEVASWWVAYQSSLAKLGMTPYDRKKVDALPEEKKKSRKDQLKERRAQAKKKMEELKNNAGKGEHVKAV
jgi:P27 family predicted phage terminase small subunit